MMVVKMTKTLWSAEMPKTGWPAAKGRKENSRRNVHGVAPAKAGAQRIGEHPREFPGFRLPLK
jgi:hypothetical protein